MARQREALGHGPHAVAHWTAGAPSEAPNEGTPLLKWRKVVEANWRVSAMVVEKKDIASVGRAMYDKLRTRMEADHWGRMVVIDVNTGDYEIDDDVTATLRLCELNPGTITWGERVGYPAPYRMSSRVTFVPYD